MSGSHVWRRQKADTHWNIPVAHIPYMKPSFDLCIGNTREIEQGYVKSRREGDVENDFAQMWIVGTRWFVGSDRWRLLIVKCTKISESNCIWTDQLPQKIGLFNKLFISCRLPTYIQERHCLLIQKTFEVLNSVMHLRIWWGSQLRPNNKIRQIFCCHPFP